MFLKQSLEVIINQYPFYKSFNKKIMKDCEEVDWSLSYDTSVYAEHSDWCTTSKNISVMSDWIISVVRHFYREELKNLTITCPEKWFVRYGEGDYANPHNHIPALYSYCYYINTPRGSSPLVFTESGKKIKAEEGMMVIFPSNLRHHVPPNKCKDRLALTGNIYVAPYGH
tara:strand:+ start:1820 stop:2329 length:510 start_codon:yes stop_codon:yes gene_type:complete